VGQALEELKDRGWPRPEVPDRGGDRERRRRAEQGHGGAAQHGEHLRRLALVDLAGVLTEGHVSNPVQAILDSPVDSPPPHQSQGIGPSLSQARDGVGYLHRSLLLASLAVFRLDHPFNPTDLSDARPGLAHGPTGAEVGIEIGRTDYPKSPRLVATVAGLCRYLVGDCQASIRECLA